MTDQHEGGPAVVYDLRAKQHEIDTDGVTTRTARAGTLTARPEDPDARIRRETWLIAHGMDPSYAGNASWVDDLIAKEDNRDA